MEPTSGRDDRANESLSLFEGSLEYLKSAMTHTMPARPSSFVNPDRGRDEIPGECADELDGFDLVIADASWSWTERLFAPAAELGSRLYTIKACDWRTALNQKRPARDWFWPCRRLAPNYWERTFILPPGWMKTLPQLGMRPIANAINAWRKSLADPKPLALVISYPHYLRLRDWIKPDLLVYYNMDDYGFYWSTRRESVRNLERRVVREADLSVFCAGSRAAELARSVPEARDRIVHLPHGAPESAIAPRPLDLPADAPADLARLPRPYLGFVGSLEDRLDWPLIDRTALEFPQGSIILVGRAPKPAPRETWYQSYRRAIAQPNVHILGWKTQSEIGSYNAAFDVCLIPYLVDHPFNRAACPTKIMDYMASTRPVVSTALPECRLHGALFDIADDAEEFIAAIGRIVSLGSDDGRAKARWRAARSWTWRAASLKFLRHLSERADIRP